MTNIRDASGEELREDRVIIGQYVSYLTKWINEECKNFDVNVFQNYFWEVSQFINRVTERSKPVKFISDSFKRSLSEKQVILQRITEEQFDDLVEELCTFKGKFAPIDLAHFLGIIRESNLEDKILDLINKKENVDYNDLFEILKDSEYTKEEIIESFQCLLEQGKITLDIEGKIVNVSKTS